MPSAPHHEQELVLSNDEGLYILARHCVRFTTTLEHATECIWSQLRDAECSSMGGWSRAGIRAALKDGAFA